MEPTSALQARPDVSGDRQLDRFGRDDSAADALETCYASGMFNVRLLLLTLTSGLLTAGCAPTREEVQQAIDDANYCDSADECVELSGDCDFDCPMLVNRAEEARIREMLEEYQDARRDSCPFMCSPLDSIQCSGGECRGVTDL